MLRNRTARSGRPGLRNQCATTPPPRSRDEAEPEEVAPGAEAAPEVAPEVDTPDSEAAATMAEAV